MTIKMVVFFMAGLSEGILIDLDDFNTNDTCSQNPLGPRAQLFFWRTKKVTEKFGCFHSTLGLIVTEGSLEVKLPTIWTDEKQRWEESERREEQKREDADARKGRKVTKHCVFSNDLWLRRVEK